VPHVIEMPDPNGNLLERILSRENIRMAWKRVKANRGASGVDGVTIREFPATICDTWDNIRKPLMGSYYEPSPVLRVEMPKSSGETRPLGINGSTGQVCSRLKIEMSKSHGQI